MKRSITALAIVVLVLSAASPAHASSFSSQSLGIQVYADGSAYMTQVLAVNKSSSSVALPLLSAVISTIAVTDQNGSPLYFKISGSNITVYTLGATGTTLRYDTQSLTSKRGTVWTINFTTDYNATVTLPKYSTLSYTSGTPYTIGVQDGSPVVTVGPGAWSMSYGVSVQPVATTTTSGGTTTTSTGPTTQGPGGTVLGGSQTQLEVLAVAVVAAVGVFLFLRWWKGRLDLGPQGTQLRPDDVQVLNFIQEKGGKVLEPEIRMRFALPKTSAWRQIKRLERLGYVKVTKIGSQNQIELLKNREPGA